MQWGQRSSKESWHSGSFGDGSCNMVSWEAKPGSRQWECYLMSSEEGETGRVGDWECHPPTPAAQVKRHNILARFIELSQFSDSETLSKNVVTASPEELAYNPETYIYRRNIPTSSPVGSTAICADYCTLGKGEFPDFSRTIGHMVWLDIVTPKTKASFVCWGFFFFLQIIYLSFFLFLFLHLCYLPFIILHTFSWFQNHLLYQIKDANLFLHLIILIHAAFFLKCFVIFNWSIFIGVGFYCSPSCQNILSMFSFSALCCYRFQ